MNEQQRQAYLGQINYGRIERVVAYKNAQFIIEHQHDTLEQLTAYLKSCMEDIGHPPAMVEVIGGEYIEYRFCEIELRRLAAKDAASSEREVWR